MIKVVLAVEKLKKGRPEMRRLVGG